MRRTMTSSPIANSRAQQYFDKNGTEISEDDATDAAGMLKDGVRMQVRMTMRDGSRNPHMTDVQRAVAARASEDAKPQFTDGRTTDPLAGCRPGFRIPAVADPRGDQGRLPALRNLFDQQDTGSRTARCSAQTATASDTSTTSNATPAAARATSTRPMIAAVRARVSEAETRPATAPAIVARSIRS
jgi:hypothetical protein